MDKLREMVSGPRNRYKEDGINLDLTYITDRIIAMSFPAATFWKKMYRNKVEDVANFLQEKHGQSNYKVYNMSGVDYDTSPFNNQVLTCKWEDHHSPTLNMLMEVCLDIFVYLNSSTENVVVVHCNAGKGRTGTLICCYLLYCGYCQTSEEALAYYGIKRFKNGQGVT